MANPGSDGTHDVVVPEIGESIATAYIGRFLRKVGDGVKTGDPLLIIDSDKASIEMPSPVSGVLVEWVVTEGDEVPIGAVIARIDTARLPEQAGDTRAPTTAAKGPQAGPAARQAAAGMGVDIGTVAGTGVRGRVLVRDVQQAAQEPETAVSPAAAPPAMADPAPLPLDPENRFERIPMTPLRRTIARRLVEAHQNTAMLTTFNEVDMTRVLDLRARYQDRFVARFGIKLGFMSFFVKACVEALKAWPAANAEIDESDPARPAIVYKHFYNIGVAVSTDRGLVVPVMRDADRLSFADTEQAIAELARKARDGQLLVDDFKDGTFSISNGGVFGSLLSTPILNPPQVAILGMHTIQKRPVELDGQVAIRPMMYLALTYDHRIIDGREAVSFLFRVKELVEAPERLLLEV